MPRRFATANVDGYPQVHLLPRVQEQALWVLAVGKDQVGLQSMGSSDIARVLCQACEVSVTRQAVEAVLKDARPLVHRSKQGRRVVYSIMKAGRDALQSAERPSVMLIEPESALAGIRAVEDLLSALHGEVRVCDPYVDGKTLDLLILAPRRSAVRLLTQNVQSPRAFRRDLQAYSADRRNLQVRLVPTRTLHDRYVISASDMYLFGQSLNGIGKKQTFVVRVGTDVRRLVVSSFDKLWAGATAFS